MEDSSGDFQSSGDGSSSRSRDQSVRGIIARVLSERSRGRAMSDSDVLAEYPDIAEDLRPQLMLADQIRQARLAAERAGAVPGQLRPLSESEFDELLKDTGQPEPPHPLLPHLPGYFIHEEINRGGQAVVYRATQESTGRAVAIKVMVGGPFVSSRHRTRFEREARILGGLDHPHIVSIIDRGRTPDGSFFFIMQYIDGLALDEFWTSELPSDASGTRQLVRLLAAIASAVEAAHIRHVVHRDLKPSNIRIDQRGDPHILDFGLARPLEGQDILTTPTITMSGQIIGSLPWASPEQAAGRVSDLDQRSDVYSIGVILFQALAGEFPYSLQGPIDQVLLRIRTFAAGPPSKSSHARPGIDRSLDCIVLKALEKDPHTRYPTAGALAQDLNNWLSGRSVLAPWRKPKPLLLPLAAAAGLCVLAAAGAWWIESKNDVPVVFDMPSQVNSIGMKMVRIPEGAFEMGSPDDEVGRERRENIRQVAIANAFFIGATDVTQDQYQKVMHDNPSDQRWRGPAMPVGNVSWINAVEFCRRLSSLEHAHYRLPTSEEWEYACRAGALGAFQDPAHPEKTVWSMENSGGQLKPVGQKLPNSWGLFDMQGNVAQWCADARSDPLSEDVQHPLMHAIRGGSAFAPVTDCRAAAEQPAAMAFARPDLGFRVVCDPR